MRTTQRASLTLGALLVAAAFPALATATTGTCTITSVSAHILAGGPGNLDLPPITVAAGVAMPVEFDEASGSFSLSRDVWASMFGSVGAGGPTGFGPNNFLIMAPGTVSGTIDAGGNITLPGFEFTFSTDACEPPKNSYPLTTNLDSSLQLLTLGLTPVEVQGNALDFSTGSVTLFGADAIPAPCLSSALVSAMSLTCTLSPIPDRSKLPAAMAVTKLVGVGKIGKPLPTEQPTKPDTGDALTLNAVIAPGGAKLDFTSPVFVRVADGSGADLMFVEVPAGKLTPKGKAYLVNDLGGSVLLVLVGQKSSGIVSSTTGGTLRFTRTKKSVKLAARLHGLDLSGFGASSSVTIAVGPYTVTAPFTKYRARSPGHKGR